MTQVMEFTAKSQVVQCLLLAASGFPILLQQLDLVNQLCNSIAIDSNFPVDQKHDKIRNRLGIGLGSAQKSDYNQACGSVPQHSFIRDLAREPLPRHAATNALGFRRDDIHSTATSQVTGNRKTNRETGRDDNSQFQYFISTMDCFLGRV